MALAPPKVGLVLAVQLNLRRGVWLEIPIRSVWRTCHLYQHRPSELQALRTRLRDSLSFVRQQFGDRDLKDERASERFCVCRRDIEASAGDAPSISLIAT